MKLLRLVLWVVFHPRLANRVIDASTVDHESMSAKSMPACSEMIRWVEHNFDLVRDLEDELPITAQLMEDQEWQRCMAVEQLRSSVDCIDSIMALSLNMNDMARLLTKRGL